MVSGIQGVFTMPMLASREYRRSSCQFKPSLRNVAHFTLDRRLLAAAVFSLPYTGNLFTAWAGSSDMDDDQDPDEADDASASETSDGSRTWYLDAPDNTDPDWSSTQSADVGNTYEGPVSTSPGTLEEVQYIVTHSHVDEITSYSHPVGLGDVDWVIPYQETYASADSHVTISNGGASLSGIHMTVVFSASISAEAAGFSRAATLNFRSTYLNVSVDSSGLVATNNSTSSTIVSDSGFGQGTGSDGVTFEFTVTLPNVTSLDLHTTYSSDFQTESGPTDYDIEDEAFFGTNTTTAQLSHFNWNVAYELNTA